MMRKVFLFDVSRGTITVTGADGSPPPPPPASAQAEEFTTFEPDSPPPPPPSLDTDEQPDDEDLASPPPPVFDEDSFEDETSLAPPPVLMDVDLPLLDGSLSLTSSNCCQMKKVGEFSYSLLGEDTLDWKLGCKNGCVYVREGLPGRRFCFREGNIVPQCF